MAHASPKNLISNRQIAPKAPLGGTYMKAIIITFVTVITLVTISLGAELPEAPSSVIRMSPAMLEVAAPAKIAKVPEANPIDKTFLGLAFISTGSTFADSYTTLFARQNWLAGKTGVCNEEVESAYLYGTHPTVVRAYSVATVKSAGSLFAAYYLRKHHSKLWALPLIGNSVSSLQGVTQNVKACN